MMALRATGLVKRFETSRAVDGVDLQVHEGEVRGLLGPNGAGKTTLLRMLFGLVARDAGTIELFDRPLDASGPLARDGVAGFVEDPRFYPYLSGRANLELMAELDGGARCDRVEAVLEQVRLADRGGDRVSAYSTGMRQRLGIAASLLRAPRLLLLDEPTSGLDPDGARDVRALVRELSTQGVAVVVSSHQIGELEEVCDTFTVLSRGVVVWEGTAAQLRAQAPEAGFALVTSDDTRALELGAREPGVGLARAVDAEGLTLAAEREALDRFVLALGRDGVAVRRLELVVAPLESMYFALTGDGPAVAGRPEQAAPA